MSTPPVGVPILLYLVPFRELVAIITKLHGEPTYATLEPQNHLRRVSAGWRLDGAVHGLHVDRGDYDPAGRMGPRVEAWGTRGICKSISLVPTGPITLGHLSMAAMSVGLLPSVGG